MKKFCIYCGKPLEGKKCDCENSKKINLKKYGNQIFLIGKGMFTKPIDTINEYAQKENFVFFLILLFLYSCMMGTSLFLLDIHFKNISIGSILQGIIYILCYLFLLIWFIFSISQTFSNSNIDFKKLVSMIGVISIFDLFFLIFLLILSIFSMKLSLFFLGMMLLFHLSHLIQGLQEISNLNKNKISIVITFSICASILVVIYILPGLFF